MVLSFNIISFLIHTFISDDGIELQGNFWISINTFIPDNGSELKHNIYFIRSYNSDKGYELQGMLYIQGSRVFSSDLVSLIIALSVIQGKVSL